MSESRVTIEEAIVKLEREIRSREKAIKLLNDAKDELTLEQHRTAPAPKVSKSGKRKKPGPKPKAKEPVSTEARTGTTEAPDNVVSDPSPAKPVGRLSNNERAVEQMLGLDQPATADEIEAEVQVGTSDLMVTLAKLIERGRVRKVLPAEMGGQARYALID